MMRVTRLNLLYHATGIVNRDNKYLTSALHLSLYRGKRALYVINSLVSNARPVFRDGGSI